MVLTLLPTVQTPLGSPRASQVRAVLAKMDVPTHLPEGRKRKAVAQSLGKKINTVRTACLSVKKGVSSDLKSKPPEYRHENIIK